jgi:hypothetical protein
MRPHFFALFVSLVVLIMPAFSWADDADKKPFPATVDAMADVDAALARAQAADKKALIILGANWCHDSKALLKKLDDPDVKALVEAGYETALINVGWYERGFEVAPRFGLAIYTHTPTMLIVDPETERVLNAHDQHIFRDAYKMKAKEVRAYFEEKAEPAGWTPEALETVSASSNYQSHMAEIAAFEQEQAARIRKGYEVIAPLLEADSDDLNTYWRPLRKLRYALPDDLLALREEVVTRVAAGETGFTLEYPTYDAFSWEE